jgi:hypothetical protein
MSEPVLYEKKGKIALRRNQSRGDIHRRRRHEAEGEHSWKSRVLKELDRT